MSDVDTRAEMAPPTTVDLTNCDREPIHLLGAIQPIGMLIALSSDWMVSRVSANIGDFFDAAPADLIGRPMSTIFSGDAIHAMPIRACWWMRWAARPA